MADGARARVFAVLDDLVRQGPMAVLDEAAGELYATALDFLRRPDTGEALAGTAQEAETLAAFCWLRALALPDGPDWPPLEQALALYESLGAAGWQRIPAQVMSLLEARRRGDGVVRTARRISRFVDSGDASGVLPDANAHEARQLLVGADHTLVGFTVARTVAVFHFCRFLARPDQEGLEDYRVALGLFDLTALSGMTPPEQVNELRTEHPRLARSAHRSLLSMGWLARRDDPALLDMVVEALGAAAAALPDTHPSRGVLLARLGVAVQMRYERAGDPADIDRAIEAGRAGLRSLSPDHADRPRYLSNLSNAYRLRFQVHAQEADIDESVRWGLEAMETVDEDHPYTGAIYGNLGAGLVARFQARGDSDDIDLAVTALRAAATAPISDGHRPLAQVYNLTHTLRLRFEHSADPRDLTEALHWSDIASGSASLNSADRSELLSERSWIHWLLSGRGEGPEELDAAIDDALASFASSVPGDQRHVERIEQLFMMRGARVLNQFELTDAHATLQAGQALVEGIRTGSRHRPLGLSDAELMGQVAFIARQLFDATSGISYLTDAIELRREAARCSTDPRLRALHLDAAEIGLRDRGRLTGAREDLAEAERLGRQSVAAAPAGDPQRIGSLSQLSATLRETYELTGDMAALDEAIATARSAADEAPPDGSEADAYTHLSGALRQRYNRNGALDDLNDAITWCRRAAAVPEPGGLSGPGSTAWRREKAAVLGNLGTSLSNRYDRLGALRDLDEAIESLQQAVDASQPDRPAYGLRLNNLALALRSRAERLSSRADLERARAAIEAAVDATPTGHRLRAGFLDTLATTLLKMFEQNPDEATIDRALPKS